jgi:hypothetical protein
VKIARLVAIAATGAIVSDAGELLDICPRVGAPLNGPGRPRTANSYY